MRVLLALLLLSSKALAYDGSWQNVASQRTLQQLNAAFEGKKLLLFGESSHDDLEPIHLITALVQTLSEDVRFLGLEVYETNQPIIDHFLATGDGPVESVHPHRLDREVAAAYREMFEAVRRCNRTRRTPLRIVALDLAASAGVPNGDWFRSREPAMVQRVREASAHFTQRGVLFFGGAHATRHPFLMPRVLRNILRLNGDFESAGSLLAHEPELLGKTLHVWLQTPVRGSARWLGTPAEFRRLYSMPAFLYRGSLSYRSTTDERFRRLEENLGFEAHPESFRISTHFDGYVPLARAPRDWRRQCRDLLALPQAALRYVALEGMAAVLPELRAK